MATCNRRLRMERLPTTLISKMDNNSSNNNKRPGDLFWSTSLFSGWFHGCSVPDQINRAASKSERKCPERISSAPIKRWLVTWYCGPLYVMWTGYFVEMDLLNFDFWDRSSLCCSTIRWHRFILMNPPSALNKESISYCTPASLRWFFNSTFLISPSQELFVYVSEESHFTDFENKEKLVWHEKGLHYGNWTDGPNMDGSRTFKTVIQASEVGFTNILVTGPVSQVWNCWHSTPSSPPPPFDVGQCSVLFEIR